MADATAGARDSERHETPTERLDRNWQDLLQELRVTQTGVQLLTGFLLTLPFQSVFASLSAFLRGTYLVTVSCAILATGFLVAPVSLHRLLFRRHLRARMVRAAHFSALVGLTLLAGAVIGVVLLTFGLVLSDTWGIVAAAITAVVLGILWVLIPLGFRRSATP